MLVKVFGSAVFGVDVYAFICFTFYILLMNIQNKEMKLQYGKIY